MRTTKALILGVLLMPWHDDMQSISAAIAGQRHPQQPFGSAKPKMPTANEELNQLTDELMERIKRGEITLEQGIAIMAPHLGQKNPQTGYYQPIPSSGQIDPRAPNDPYEVRKAMQQQGWGVR